MNSAADEAFATATCMTASWLDLLTRSGKRIMECRRAPPKLPTVYLQPTLRGALRDLGIGPVDGSEVTLELPNWNGPPKNPWPKGVDVVVRDGETASPRYVAELKMRDTDQTLWDLYKMIDALNLTGIEAGYLIVGASEEQLAKQREACGELFGDDGLTNYPSRQLFEDNKRAWWNLLHGGSARPTRVPETVTTRVVATCPLTVDDRAGWLTCVAVDSGDGGFVEFPDGWCHGNWPDGVVPGREYFDQPPRNGARGLPLPAFPDPGALGRTER